MEKKAFKLLHDAESSWWYRGRRQTVERVLTLLSEDTSPKRILDVGAGFGGMLSTLKAYGEVYAMEPDQEARNFATSRGYKKVFSSLEDIKKEGITFDLIGAFDVIEHTSYDAKFLHQLEGLLLKGGNVVATVPAYPWLWSAHDVLHHHHHRYTKKTFRALFENAGLSVRYLGHWNMFLLPLAVLSRIIGKSGEDSMRTDSLLDRVFKLVLFVETRLIPFFHLPFGVSLVIFARKD